MNDLTRMALPVPALGTALGDAGDAYVDSLRIELLVDGERAATVDGTVFEVIVSAMRVRHLAFHPRTRAFVAGGMKARSAAESIDRHWSAIESYGHDVEGVEQAAKMLADACRKAGMLAWIQTN